MTIHIPFDNSYARLPERFYGRQPPTPVAGPPGLIALNAPLAEELGLDPATLAESEGLEVLAGNRVPEGAAPLAQAYAGHQFGGWVPQLGDGRALLLGEVVDVGGQRRDIQLKGSGRTAFSRMGDGRAWLGPVIREYLVSEAMHALGVPTTRALAAVSTGEQVFREAPMPGAVLVRVASSHIRVGTFQFFAARKDVEALERLAAHVVARHYPDASGPLEMLEMAVERHARLMARWMSVGFIHGVMNTDNAHVAGETIDYGPCAFMDAYHPDTVFSSIDRFGRYAYARQPEMANWNLAQFAIALLPLLGGDDAAVEAASAAVRRFPDLYEAAWLDAFRAKIGLASTEDGDVYLIRALLENMANSGADFTNAFRALSRGEAPEGWVSRWEERLARDGRSREEQIETMRKANPAVIPRNHRIEKAIQDAVSGNLDTFRDLNRVLSTPYELGDADAAFADPPAPEERVLRTFCGT